MINKIGSWFYQLLRKSQKYTGTDNIYLAKGGFWLTFGQASSMLIYFLVAVAFANLLDPITYGNYKYALSLLGMLVIFTLLGMGKAVTQATARGIEGSFYSGFKMKLKWGLAGSLAALAGAVYYWLRGNNWLPIPMLLIAGFLPLMEASKIYTSFLEGKKLFGVKANFNLISQAGSAMLIVAALFLTKNVFWLIAVYLASHAIIDYSLYQITKIKFNPNREGDPQTFNYGKHLSLMGVISQGATYADKVLLFMFMGASQLAIYSFAMMIPEEIQKILGNITVLAMPKFAAKSREEIKSTIMKKFWKLCFVVAAAIILYIIIAPYFYKIFFPKYLESVLYSQVFMISFISIPAGFLGTAFEAKMMKKELYLIKIAPFVNIALMAFLIPMYGIWGGIISITSAQIFKTALVLFLFRKF